VADSVPRHHSATPVTLTDGGYRAEVSPVGARLVRAQRGDVDLVLVVPDGVVPSPYAGAVLAPWPNRIYGASYSFEGTTYGPPANEAATGSALHGLVAFLVFDPVEVTSESVLLRTMVARQPGYPTALEVEVAYRLDDEGLTGSVTARNMGDHCAPYGLGWHPYLVAPDGGLEDWRLTLPANGRCKVDVRGRPTGGTGAVDGTDLDFRDGREIAGAVLDVTFTDLTPGRDAAVRVQGPDGRGVELSAIGDWAGFWQVYTSDTIGPVLHRKGLAVEPMTCPPDAFRSGDSVIRLPPGDVHKAAWRLRALP
jgi:aldose 1-epimerase